MTRQKVNIVWLRRSLRLHDNLLLKEATKYKTPMLLIYIMDENRIYNSRVKSFILYLINQINNQLKSYNSEVLILNDNYPSAIKSLFNKYTVCNVITNEDYEPQQIIEDVEIEKLLKRNNCDFITIKDHVIFSPNEVLKQDDSPYSVYTPYKKKWLENLTDIKIEDIPELNVIPIKNNTELSYNKDDFKPFTLSKLNRYAEERDFPQSDAGSYIGAFLRYGGVSIREIVKQSLHSSSVYLSELIWREFFMQILFHYPHSQHSAFKPAYSFIPWKNNEELFNKWKAGKTGVPLVDAGMIELAKTGYMHNRVRMVTASFLVKNLFIDWRLGEAWFAENLLDYELSSNIGNWQWVAGTGCDAAPYFRVFNPFTQQEKFDKNFEYIKKWIPDFNKSNYIEPIVDVKETRKQAIDIYKQSLSEKRSINYKQKTNDFF